MAQDTLFGMRALHLCTPCVCLAAATAEFADMSSSCRLQMLVDGCRAATHFKSSGRAANYAEVDAALPISVLMTDQERDKREAHLSKFVDQRLPAASCNAFKADKEETRCAKHHFARRDVLPTAGLLLKEALGRGFTQVARQAVNETICALQDTPHPP